MKVLTKPVNSDVNLIAKNLSSLTNGSKRTVDELLTRS